MPPLTEQQEIVRILSIVDEKIAAEKNRKRSLEILFKTLLHNLMTGKLRAKDAAEVPMRRDEVLKVLAEHREELEEFGVKRLAIFGSVARDEAGPESDVDLLVEFNKPIGLFEFVDLKNRLEELLGRPVDLATKNGLKRQLRDRILEEAILCLLETGEYV